MLGQRRYERVAFYCPVKVTVLPNGPVMEGNTFDISIGGVGIVAERHLERGQNVRVRFYIHNGNNKTIEEEALGRIAYSRADEDCTRIGIEFFETVRDTSMPALAHKLDTLR
jgi:c-di-GMP-binding flagellar brake protein YcgR